MPVADSSFGWQEATAAFAIIAVVAFLVTWVVTDLGHVSRTPYVAVLTLTTLALSAGYIAWSGTSVADPRNDGVGLGRPRRSCRNRGGHTPRPSSARGTSP